MSFKVSDKFKELVKNNEYNNISIKYINDSKRGPLRKVTGQNLNRNKKISIVIPNNHLSNNYLQNKTINSISVNTNPSNYRQNKIFFNPTKKNSMINKITTANLRKIGRKLKEIKHYDSSSYFKRGENTSNHKIYISKKDDYAASYEINNNYTQIMPVNKLSGHLTSKMNTLHKRIKEPERRKSSLIYSINNITQNINNKNIINNYIFDSNTYTNSNVVPTTNFKYYNEFVTYNVNQNRDSNYNNIYRNKKDDDDNLNKLYFNNTLTTIKDIKNGNLLTHRLNLKDLEKLKNSKNLTSHSSSKKNFFFNPIINKSYVNDIPKRSLIKYGSKDKIFENIYQKENNFKNVIRVSSTSKRNIPVNSINEDINDKYMENNRRIKINKKIINGTKYQNYIGNAGIKFTKDYFKSLMFKNNIKDIINRSMDSKEIEIKKISPKINLIQNNIHLKNPLSPKIYNNDYQGSNDERHKLNKIEEENSKYDSNSGSKNEKIFHAKNLKEKIKYKQIIVNKTLNTEKNKIKIPNYSSKTFNPKNQEQKEIMRKVNRNDNIQPFINSKENKTLQLESEAKKIINQKNENDTKSQASEKIKSIILDKNYDLLKKKAKISFTTKKDLTNMFNSETMDSNSKNEINTKHISYKGVNYRLVSSLSVKDQLRKYILGRKKNMNKYQYNDDDELSMSNYTHTARKDNNLNNYTYLELKDIKNIKRDTFITLHSVGRIKDNESRFDDLEHSSAFIDFKDKEFKTYVSTHPEKKFKKRGFRHFRGKSERRISGIKIEGNSDTIEYQFDRTNLKTIKENPFMGKSTQNIFHGRMKGNQRKLKRDNSDKNLDLIFKRKFNF